MNEEVRQERLNRLVTRGQQYQRFRCGDQLCPRCGKPALEDHWPPNYWFLFFEPGDERGCERGSMKYVCVPCKTAFLVSYDGPIPAERKVSEITPLIEKGGKLLTPHDVWTEKYKEEHGEYPQESYS